MQFNGFKVSETAGQIITCKAAVVWGPEEPFVMEEVQVEPPQRMEVRIRILFTSVCHTDLSAWKGEVWELHGTLQTWRKVRLWQSSVWARLTSRLLKEHDSEASQIIGVDINSEKAEKGREMGITNFIDPSKYTKPLHEVIREMSKGGVDYSFECTGNLDVLREAFMSTQDGGGLTVILGIHPTPRLLPLHPMELHGRNIVGCVFGGFKGKSQLPGLVEMCMKEENKINLSGFITHELPFDANIRQ